MIGKPRSRKNWRRDAAALTVDLAFVMGAVNRLQRTQENRSVLCARLRQVDSHQEARHKSAQGHQPVHKGANSFQGEASSEDHQGSSGKGCQRRYIVASKTTVELDRCVVLWATVTGGAFLESGHSCACAGNERFVLSKWRCPTARPWSRHHRRVPFAALSATCSTA